MSWVNPHPKTSDTRPHKRIEKLERRIRELEEKQ